MGYVLLQSRTDVAPLVLVSLPLFGAVPHQAFALQKKQKINS